MLGQRDPRGPLRELPDLGYFQPLAKAGGVCQHGSGLEPIRFANPMRYGLRIFVDSDFYEAGKRL